MQKTKNKKERKKERKKVGLSASLQRKKVKVK
jgi:hypothetical protein